MVKQANIDVSTIGNNTIVAAVSGKQIWVLKCVLISNGSVNVTFRSGTGKSITGPFYLVANGGFSAPQDDGQRVSPFCRTDRDENLVLNLSAGIAVGGVLSYIEVDGGEESSSSSCRSSSSSSRSSSSSSRSSSSSSSRSSSSCSSSRSSSSSSSSSCRSSSSSSCRSSSSSSVSSSSSSANP